MSNKIGLIGLTCIICCFFLSGKCQAQSCIDSEAIGWLNWLGVANYYLSNGWTCEGDPLGGGVVFCKRPKSTCPPAAAASETRGKCPFCSSPVSLTDGNTFITQTDVDIPGLGGGLRLVRTWNSLWPSSQQASEIGIFGQHWTSNLEERSFVGSDGYVKYLRYDGSFWSFGGISGQSSVLGAAAPANATETLATGTSNWTIVAKNGDTKVFDVNTGKLLSISDRNGNTTTLTYDSALRLVTVTDPASRHLYFTYGQGGASNLVTGVTSDVGITVSYFYDAYQRLVQVTRPDGTKITFEYGESSINNPASPLITAVKDNEGKLLEAHTYDAEGKGMSGNQALGVNGVIVNWPEHVFRFSTPSN